MELTEEYLNVPSIDARTANLRKVMSALNIEGTNSSIAPVISLGFDLYANEKDEQGRSYPFESVAESMVSAISYRQHLAKTYKAQFLSIYYTDDVQEDVSFDMALCLIVNINHIYDAQKNIDALEKNYGLKRNDFLSALNTLIEANDLLYGSETSIQSEDETEIQCANLNSAPKTFITPDIKFMAHILSMELMTYYDKYFDHITTKALVERVPEFTEMCQELADSETDIGKDLIELSRAMDIRIDERIAREFAPTPFKPK